MIGHLANNKRLFL
jgi:hypothetical protein